MQKYEKYLSFLSLKFRFLKIKFSIYLNRRVFVMNCALDEIQVTGIYSRAILAAVTSECCCYRVIYKTWTGTFGVLENSADPDQTPQMAVSDQILHCLLKLHDLRVK